MVNPTPKQQKTIDMLLSRLDDMEMEPESDGSIIVQGVSSDGPMLGYIETNGQMTWLT
jgi:hypothetical protein